MEFLYKNNTLYVKICYAINGETILNFERKIFKILDDYGIEKVVVSLFGNDDKRFLNHFRSAYYQKYSGFLLLK